MKKLSKDDFKAFAGQALKVFKYISMAIMFLLKFLDDALLVVGFLLIYKTTDSINHIAGSYLLGFALMFAGWLMLRRR
jgi:hypothetical protein